MTLTRKNKIDAILSGMGFDPNNPGSLGGMLSIRLRKVNDTNLDLIPAVVFMQETHGNQFKFLYTVVDDEDEDLLREILFFYPLIRELDQVMLKLFINGLRHIEYFQGVTNMATLTGRHLETALAFIKVTSALNLYLQDEGLEHVWTSAPYTYITDKELHTLIISYPDKADELAAYIAERRDGSPESLRKYVETTAGLRTGAL